MNLANGKLTARLPASQWLEDVCGMIQHVEFPGWTHVRDSDGPLNSEGNP